MDNLEVIHAILSPENKRFQMKLVVTEQFTDVLLYNTVFTGRTNKATCCGR